MSRNWSKTWLQVSALTLSSPFFAGLFLLTVALIASFVPFPHSVAQWLSDDMLVRAIGFALFTALLSIDLMLQSFYLSLPILVGGAIALLRLDMGIQSKFLNTFILATSMGVLYAVVYLAGSSVGWIKPAFYT